MFIVTSIAQKGGVGKTTLTTTLAVLADMEGLKAGIVDADPSLNATRWHQRRVMVNAKETPVIVPANDEESLRAAIKAAREDGFDWLFIDTGAGVSDVPGMAAKVADLLLIPCPGTANNIDGMEPTANLVQRLGKPGFFVINKGRNSQAMNDRAALALTSLYGVPAVSHHITFRLPIGDVEDGGLSLIEHDSKDASCEKGRQEFRALWAWLKKQRGKSNGKH